MNMIMAQSLVKTAATPFEWVARAWGWRWFALVGLECVCALICGTLLWYVTGGVGVPEVDEPFDMVAFQRAIGDTDDSSTNEFVKSYELYKPPEGAVTLPLGRRSVGAVLQPIQPDDPAVAAWLDKNAACIEWFLRGAKRSDNKIYALHGTNSATSRIRDDMGYQNLAQVVLQESAQRQRNGDFEGAWECIRAVLRVARLVGRHGSLFDRINSGGLRTWRSIG